MKKCLTVSLLAAFALGLSPSALANKTPLSHAEVLQLIKQELRARQTQASVDFKSLLKKWEVQYNTQAVEPLFSVARDRSLPDPDRYIALMGGAKIGGTGTSGHLVSFLKDPSWMIRNGALRALIAIRARNNATDVLPLLKDPALVVRLEAVTATEQLRPSGAREALLSTLSDPANYHRGKAQWVPQRALAALTRMGDPSLAPRLKPILDRFSSGGDAEFTRVTIQALEKLTGKTLKRGQPLKTQVQAWRAYL